jgi:hypothetical protein
MTEGGPDARLRPSPWPRRVSGVLLGVLVAGTAYVADQLHRRGHTTGDDFALYLRQAGSLFNGNIAKVIADNVFLADNSVGVTPGMYPWGYPLLLSPFVRWWGLDYERLKLVDVAALCIWLVLFHGIVRRRAGRIVALALTAVFATAPVYLLHTDQLLTELPDMAAVALVIWMLDRIMRAHRTTTAPTSELIVLGLLVVFAYNVRRESIVLVAVVAAAQLVDLVAARSRSIPWRRLATPHLTFVVGAALAQFLLPATLIPDNDNSKRYIATRVLTDYPAQLTTQLGLDSHLLFGRILLALAAAGVVVSCAVAPRRNVPLAVLMFGTMLLVGTHFRMVSRYYYQVTPWVAYFATMLVVVYVQRISARVSPGGPSLRVRRALLTLAVLPALWVTALHVWALPSRVEAARRFNDSGATQSGPTNPRNVPVYDAIRKNTHTDDVILYYRARTLTLYTDRPAYQTTSVNNLWKCDFFMQSLRSDYSQPRVSAEDLIGRGFEAVWESSDWRLWRCPDDAVAPGQPPSPQVPGNEVIQGGGVDQVPVGSGG